MGKRIGEWVYEIFITTLPIEGFLVEDVILPQFERVPKAEID